MEHTGAGGSRYGSEDFEAFSAAVRELEAARRGRRSELLRVAGRRRRAVWRGVRLVQRLDDLELPLSSSPAGDAIWRTVQSRRARLARAVLQLPEDRVHYQRGRSRQALRTNVHHAEALGVVCRELTDVTAKNAALDELLRGLGRPETAAERRYLEQAIGLETDRQPVHVAVDAAGDVVALAVVELDMRCARLVFLHAVAGPVGAPARYALSLHLINALIDEHVGLLLVGGTVRLSPGLQYFQQRLGFEIFNVRPVRLTHEWIERPVQAASRFAPWRRRMLRPSSSGSGSATGVGGRVP